MIEVDTGNKKDKLFLFDKEELSEPLSRYSMALRHMAEYDPSEPGLVLPNGTINWSCPCLGNAGIGPCSEMFRESFKCFHFSEAKMKGTDCIQEFEKLQECMKKYPKLYK